MLTKCKYFSFEKFILKNQSLMHSMQDSLGLFQHNVFETALSKLMSILKFQNEMVHQTQSVLSFLHMCVLFAVELFTAQEMKVTRFLTPSLSSTDFGFTFYQRPIFTLLTVSLEELQKDFNFRLS